jgi:hypothetical protein
VWNVKGNVNCGLRNALSEGLKGSLENTARDENTTFVEFSSI